jgi:hypothetical protein
MIILEAARPRFAHDRLGWKARPRLGQIDILNETRKRILCLGSPAPMNELLSLRDYGRVISRSDGPSFRVTWSEDGQIVSWDNQHLSMSQFQQVGQDSLQATAAICSQLMYGWSPQIDLSQVHDDLSCNAAGYSFVTAPANGLVESYLEFSRRASLATVNGLTTDNDWDHKAVRRYLDQYVEMTSSMMLLVVLLGGQTPRITELSALEHCNGPSTTRAVCVYAGKMGLIFRHAKSRRRVHAPFPCSGSIHNHEHFVRHNLRAPRWQSKSTIASMESSQAHFRFLDLPKEVRLNIYERLPRRIERHEMGIDYWRNKEIPHRKLTIILRTVSIAMLSACRQINSKASPVVHGIARRFMLFQPLRLIFEAQDHFNDGVLFRILNAISCSIASILMLAP